jgi:hypothetical protein
MKVCIAGALVVSALAGASSASATSWTSNGTAGGAAYNGTSPPSKLLTTATGPGAKTTGIICNTVTGSGNVFGPTNAGPTWAGAATLTPAFANCNVAGITAVVACAATNLNAVSYATPVVTGNLTGVNCRITVPSSGCGVGAPAVTGGITVTGSVPADYNNTAFQLTVKATGQSLNATWAPGCKATMGTSPGTAVFGTATAGVLLPADLVTTVTSAFKPSIVQP